MTLYAGSLGALYAASLWTFAVAIAARRGLTLGAFPVIELAACSVAAMVVANALPGLAAAPVAAALVATTVCAVVDARTGLIFDPLNAVAAIIALTLALASGRIEGALLAAISAGGSLCAIYVLSKKRGIGLGDVKLGTAMALGLSVAPAMVAIGSAFVIGAGYGITKIALRRAQRSDVVRFGPFIACGAVIGVAVDLCGLLA